MKTRILTAKPGARNGSSELYDGDGIRVHPYRADALASAMSPIKHHNLPLHLEVTTHPAKLELPASGVVNPLNGVMGPIYLRGFGGEIKW